jgi:hypothetical protein
VQRFSFCGQCSNSYLRAVGFEVGSGPVLHKMEDSKALLIRGSKPGSALRQSSRNCVLLPQNRRKPCMNQPHIKEEWWEDYLIPAVPRYNHMRLSFYNVVLATLKQSLGQATS